MIEKHTPLPWFIFGHGHCLGGPADTPNGKAMIATCTEAARTPEEIKANAAFILRAVNSHADLLAASQLLLRVAEKCGPIDAIEVIGRLYGLHEILSMARAAIAKAVPE